jgi:hypothetical protein
MSSRPPQHKERPILMSAPMVLAILSGSKTQTRRVVPQWQIPKELDHIDAALCEARWHAVAQRHPRYWFAVYGTTESECVNELSSSGCCPKGKPGDHLYVREAWASVGSTDPGLTVYRADYPECVPSGYENIPPADAITWKPSIHMFRRDSRITLEITDVRVERLQDISEEDAKAEGCDESTSETAIAVGWYEKPKRAFRRLWETINGDDSWDANPWVWVIKFKRLEP